MMENDRLEPIAYLSETYSIETDYESLAARESWAKTIHDEYGILPTIGCEIEVKLSALYPGLLEEYFGPQDEYGHYAVSYQDLAPEKRQELDRRTAIFEREKKPAYQEVWQQAGIPKGKDAFWEFAHSPSYAWQTLAAEVNMLFAADLIPDDKEHSLHVTQAVDATGGGMALVLSGLELCYVSPERIAAATIYNRYDKRSGWARKGRDGQRTPPSDQLRLGASVATEFRTLTVSSAVQAKAILQTAQMLSSVLLAFRQRQETTSPVIREMASFWPSYRKSLYGLWNERKLPIASWGHPAENPEPWLGWAACLTERAASGSPETDLVCRIGSLVAIVSDLLLELA
jgi:hypothetical protein